MKRMRVKKWKIKRFLSFLFLHIFSILFFALTIAFVWVFKKAVNTSVWTSYESGFVVIYCIFAILYIVFSIIEFRNREELKIFQEAKRLNENARSIGLCKGESGSESIISFIKSGVVSELRSELKSEIEKTIKMHDNPIKEIKTIPQIVLFQKEMLNNWDCYENIPVSFSGYICYVSGSIAKLSAVPNIDGHDAPRFRVLNRNDIICDIDAEYYYSDSYVIYLTEKTAIERIRDIKSKVKEDINNDVNKPVSFDPPIRVSVIGKLSRDTLTETITSWVTWKENEIDVLTVKDCEISLDTRSYV
jgi:hypothetical protein